MDTESGTGRKPLLGEILVQNGLITEEMLAAALRRQTQVGKKIGAVLVEMGFITTESLLDHLSNQLGIPAVNLFTVDIPIDTLRKIPLDRIKEFKMLPLNDDGTLTVAMVNPRDYAAIHDLEFIIGRRVNPVIVPSNQLDAAIRSMGDGNQNGLKGSDIEKSCSARTVESNEIDLTMLLRQTKEMKATDLQLTAGVPPSMKLSSELRRLNMPALAPDTMTVFAKTLLGPERYSRFETENNLDFSYADVDNSRFRVNIYKQRNSVSITMRRIPDSIPSLSELGLPPDIENFALKTQGLILITGPAGHGKSTTMAALVDLINTRRKCNIITLEDPIEYLFKHKSSNVNQREIGKDTSSFHDGLRHIFRQSPDVIVIGEMRDPESFRIALQAAETGHLVLSTLHSRHATSTIERVVEMFPGEEQVQIRAQMAECLLLVLSQRLIMNKERSGLTLAYEKLANSYKIKTFIRDGKTHQIRTQMQLPGDEYSSIDVSLIRLTLGGLITEEEGSKHADNLTFYQDGIIGKVLR